MMHTLWLRRIRRWMFSHPTSPIRTAPKKHSVRPRLEPLEDRILFAAQMYTVNLTTDNTPGTGQQNGPNAGDLRYCVEQADLNAGSTIQFDPNIFPAGASTTISLSQGELDISASMTIIGPGAGANSNSLIVSGSDGKGGASRIFDVSNQAAVVSISGLTITNGNASVIYSSVPGNQGGDIANHGSLTLTNDIVSDGQSWGGSGGPQGRGGGIFNFEGTNGTSGASLVLDNTIVEDNLAQGFVVSNFQGSQGLGAGGGVWNDPNATLTVEGASEFLNNQALGWNSPNGPLFGGSAADAGPGEGGAIYNAGNVNLDGSSTTPLIFNDNLAGGGKGGDGAKGFTPPTTGPGGSAGNGGAGGAALGGGVYNTGSAFTLTYVDFTGDQANGGAGGAGGIGGNAAGSKGWNGGNGGQGNAGGYAEGGAVYNGTNTALNFPNIVFGTDTSGMGNEANGGAGGAGGAGGNGTTGSSVPGGNGGNAGNAGAGGLARGGAVANVGNNLTFTSTTFASSEANGGAGGNGGSNGTFPQPGSPPPPPLVFGHGGPGSGNGIVGGNAGNGGAAADGGLAQGGAIYNQSGNLSLTNDPSTITFAASEANGGAGGIGGNGGTGGHGGTSFGSGGLGGLAGKGGNGGAAQGGGVFNVTGTVTISGSNFEANAAGTGNHAASGNGGAGGNGGLGGTGGDAQGKAGTGGNGGAAGNAGNAGLAAGGGVFNSGSHANVSNAIFSSSYAQSGSGGNGGNGGTGGDGGDSTKAGYGANGYGGSGGNAGDAGNSATAFGGAIAITASDLVLTSDVFGGSPTTGNTVAGGAGGVGGLGGTVGRYGNTGDYWHINRGAALNFKPGTEVPGNGGTGGIGATVYGGAISTSQGAQAVTITGSNFTYNAIASGAGGAGGSGGLFGFNGTRLGPNGEPTGISGPGGNAGAAIGGTLSFVATTAQNAILTNDNITNSSATGGAGGAGAISFGINQNTSPPQGITPPTLSSDNGFGYGSDGGIGGSVQGVEVAALNYNLTITSSTLGNGTGTAGAGGTGGGADLAVPYSWAGGTGGNGGSVQGGSVFFSNSLSQTTLNFFLNGSLASNNALVAGNGGFGGNAGASTSSNRQNDVTGGAGGNGGSAQGGGLYILTGGTSVTVTSLNYDNLLNDTVTGGVGGIGGAGYNSVGGIGGDADGGALYNNSVNSTKPSNLSLTAVTLAADQATGGGGGRSGSGTQRNGGAGGPGGNGGNADGGALYNGNNTPLTVINSTFGGSGGNANIVTGGRAARGGDAGTAGGTLPAANGGTGGNGGSVAGGNVYIASNTATFDDDTIVYGQAAAYGQFGDGGGGAGQGGQVGPAGANGTGTAGGYYANAGSNNIVANSIIGLDIAEIDSDVFGAFASTGSVGNNVLGDPTGSTGFTDTNNNPINGNHINVTMAALNLGPLQNNGGVTPGAPGNTSPILTEALQTGSVAIGAGNTALVPSGITTDERGSGTNFNFVRVYNGSLDVGAFETQPSPSPSPPPGPPPGPPGPPPSPTPPPGSNGLTTITAIASIQNSYPGLVQIETVTADVTNINGFIVNEGVVTFQVNGQTIFAAVHNGVATATFATGLLDFSKWQDLLFSHPLTASYSDGSGLFAPSGDGQELQAIWLDYFLSLFSSQLRGLTQFQAT